MHDMAMAHRPFPISKEAPGGGCVILASQGDASMVSVFDIGLTFSLGATSKHTRTPCNIIYYFWVNFVIQLHLVWDAFSV